VAKKSKSKYYVVWVGQIPGVYNTWAECQAQVMGFPNAKYKSFSSLKEADKAFFQDASIHLAAKKTSKSNYHNFKNEILSDSISVDAACSGKTGLMEYRGVHTMSKEEIFKKGPYKDGTNNVGEFLALVHGIALLKKLGQHEKVIYTDSKTALSWIKNKKVKTTLKKSPDNQILFDMIDRAIIWLNQNTYQNKILKWETKKWGEIPADFGRK